jgi:hypothetical protein
MGLLDDKKKSQYLQMAEEKLQGLLNIPQQAQRFITNPTAFLGLLGQNPLPRESGFAAGATGLPPTEMSVLDPNQAPYMQGYGQGEPVGYAGMALPFAAPAAVATGRALAPKAGQAIESYMANQGLLQPLTAYHGSPYRFDKFDPAKIGTGQGAQLRGEGMYFAEDLAIASPYSKIVPSGMSPTPNRQLFGKDVEPMTPEYKVSQLVDEMGVTKAKKFISDWAKDPLPDQVGYVDNLQSIISNVSKKSDAKNLGASNMYKVDIPDEQIPKMLDYDKPLKDQPLFIQNVALANSKAAIKEFKRQNSNNLNVQKLENIYDLTGADFMSALGGKGKAEKILKENGVYGIKYAETPSLRTTESGKKYMDRTGEGTSNYVVFDPSDVKILERNKKKQGLLD